MSTSKSPLNNIRLFPSRAAFPYFELDQPELLVPGNIISNCEISSDEGETIFAFILKQWNHFYESCVPHDLYFVVLKRLENKDCKVLQVVDNESFLNCFIERNRFTTLTPLLQNLGVSEQLLSEIRARESFFGVIEVCTCGLEACKSRLAYIVMHEDNTFSIPFLYSYTNRTIEPFIERVEPFTNIQEELMKHRTGYDDRKYVTSFFSLTNNREESYPFPTFCSGYKPSFFDFIPERNISLCE